MPDIQNMRYIAQLEEFDSPMIKICFLESTIAEKLEIISIFKNRDDIVNNSSSPLQIICSV